MVLSEIGVPAGEPGASIVIQSVGLWYWQAFSLPTDPCISKSAGPNEGLVSSPRRQWMRASSGDAEHFLVSCLGLDGTDLFQRSLSGIVFDMPISQFRDSGQLHASEESSFD